MIRVNRRDNESIDKLLRRFKKKCDKEGLIKDIKKNEYYESKGTRRRRNKLKQLKNFKIDN